MPKVKNIIITIVVFALSIFFTNCSSSSFSQRYNQPKAKQEASEKKTERFSSKDDPVPSSPDTTEVYSIPDELEEFDEMPIEDYPVEKDTFINKIKKLENYNLALTTREKILFEIIRFLDTPYKYGGNSSSGIDCSAFTQNVFGNSIGFELPRTAREQFQMGARINKESLDFGDLLFFNTSKRSYPGHVGIYIGEDKFAHASRTLGVTITSINSTYYKNRFIGGKRILTLEN